VYELEALQAVYGDIRALGAELVVLSAELPNFSADLAAQHQLAFPILRDQGLATAKAFGLAFALPDDLKDVYLHTFKNDLAKRNGDPSWQLPMPARFVIDRGGIIRSADADPDYTVRPEPDETVAFLKTLV
jgi:peroxiredoxin